MKTFKEFILSEDINTSLYKLASQIAQQSEIEQDLLYVYGDSDEEINRASKDKKYIKAVEQLKSLKLKLKDKTPDSFSKVIRDYEQEKSTKMSKISPSSLKTKEGKLFLRALTFKENNKRFDIISPNGDFTNGWIIQGKVIDDTHISNGYDTYEIDEKTVKEFSYIIEQYMKMLGKWISSSGSFRDNISNGNRDAREEIDLIIDKKIPILYNGSFSGYTKNW